MKSPLLFSVVLFGCIPAALGGSSASAGGGSKKFVVKDIELGTPLASLKAKGFTCGPDKGNSAPTCVKFLDDKCKDKKIIVRAISMNTPVPTEAACLYDSATGATFFDHEQTTVPMSHVAAKGTDTKIGRIYDISFTFAMNILGDDTKLGKALIDKYGKPVLVNPPSQLAWDEGGVQVQAICGSSTADWGQFCSVTATDNTILESDRSVQKGHDDANAKKNAPDAPAL